MAKTIYGTADIARHFGVDNAVVSNWKKRGGAPEPDFITGTGREFWASIDAWVEWRNEGKAKEIERIKAQLDKAKALEERLAALEAGEVADDVPVADVKPIKKAAARKSKSA